MLDYIVPILAAIVLQNFVASTPQLTTTPTEAIGNSVSVEVNGKRGSHVFINGVEVGIIESDGNIILDLNTSGAVGTQNFEIILHDNANHVSKTLNFSLEKREAEFDFSKTNYTLMAWNDLGMHCMDGDDFSVFSLLPPYNTLLAQLVVKGDSPRLADEDITLTYEALDDGTKPANTTSSNKTNFWDYAVALFPSLGSLAEDIGLAGNPAQSTTPSPMSYNSAYMWWAAEGIPTSPKADDGSTQHYPMVKVVASKDGMVLAETTAVLPVSDEMDCAQCHSGSNDIEVKRDILTVHDRKNRNAVSDNNDALIAKGYNYNTAGLIATVDDGTPVLCAACHKTNALPGTGVNDIIPLSAAIHNFHASVEDIGNSLSLGDNANRDACYACHPGQTTQCLRGAMGNAKDEHGDPAIECQSCHGNMYAVAKTDREAWFDEPNCQSCHQDGKRYTEAITDPYEGTLRAVLDNRFATEPNKPMEGKSLYRFSSGHGGVSCAGCHGSPHAIYPSSLPEDNLQSIALQGHEGTLRECGACHGDSELITANKGPHGMHSTGQGWVNRHGKHVKESGTADCKYCHGDDLAGTPLSKTGSRRSFKGLSENHNIIFEAGHKVACVNCHTNEIN